MLDILKGIYGQISGFGEIIRIIFEYIQQFFDIVGRTVETVSIAVGNFAPFGLSSVLVALLTALIIFKILGR